MFRKGLCVLLALTLLLAVPAAFPAAAGDPAGEFTYEIVTRDGCAPYVQLTQYTGQETDLTLPAEIEGVPVRAVVLSGFSNRFLERLVIPETVQIVHCGTIIATPDNLTTLRELVLPEGLKVIGVRAFRYATALTKLMVPYSVSQILFDAFPDDLTLRVEKGSYAHRWAVANDHPFELIAHDCSPGDPNADGLCTTTDARLALQQAAGRNILTPKQSAAADVDGTPGLTTTDARLILQHTAGKVSVPTISLPATFQSPLFDENEVVTASERLYDGRNHNLIEARDPVDNPRLLVKEINRRVFGSYYSGSEKIKGLSTREVSVKMKECTFGFNGWGEIGYYGYLISLW